MVFVVAIVGGCMQHHGSQRRPDINELIQDAIEHSARQPQGVIACEADCEECPLQLGADHNELVEISDKIVPVSGEETVEILPVPPVHGSAWKANAEILGEHTEGPLLNEEFIETDVREALLLLAEEADVEILLDEQVRGVVNISLSDVTFEKALEVILLPLGYVFAVRDGRYLIGPADPKSPLFQHIAVQYEYRPRHLSPKTLMDTTPRSMKDFVLEVDGANTLVIYAPERHARLLLDRYTHLDQPVPQVLLEAIICVVSPDCGFRFGVNWGHAVELDGKTALDMGVSGLAINTKFSPAGFDAMFRDFATTSFFIRKLAEHGYLTIRAAPRVMARDNEQAHIAINRETFFTVQGVPSDSSNASNSFFFQQDIQKVESGITLDITPRIRGDRKSAKTYAMLIQKLRSTRFPSLAAARYQRRSMSGMAAHLSSADSSNAKQ